MRCLTMALCFWLICMATTAHAGGYRNLRPGPPALELESFFDSTFPEALPQLPVGSVVAHFPCAVPATFVFADRSLRTYMLPSEARLVAVETGRDSGGVFYQLLYLLKGKRQVPGLRFAYPICLTSDPVYVPSSTSVLVLEQGPASAPSVSVAPAVPPQSRPPLREERQDIAGVPSIVLPSASYFPYGAIELEAAQTAMEPSRFASSVRATFWPAASFGLTAAFTGRDEHSLDTPVQGWLGGVAFRTDELLDFQASLMLGEERSEGERLRRARVDAEASLAFLRSEFRLDHFNTPASDLWTRTRVGTAIWSGDASEAVLGGQYVNHNHKLVPEEGVYYVAKLGARYNRASYGGYLQYSTSITRHFLVQVLIGSGKGSEPAMDYDFEAELRIGAAF